MWVSFLEKYVHFAVETSIYHAAMLFRRHFCSYRLLDEGYHRLMQWLCYLYLKNSGIFTFTADLQDNVSKQPVCTWEFYFIDTTCGNVYLLDRFDLKSASLYEIYIIMHGLNCVLLLWWWRLWCERSLVQIPVSMITPLIMTHNKMSCHTCSTQVQFLQSE